MAKTIWVCSKKQLGEFTEKKLQNICSCLTPDNITPNKPEILVEDKLAFAVVNPNGTQQTKENSLALGVFFDEIKNWHIPQKHYPDGSYSMFRYDEKFLELVSDATASRAIWYYMDDQQFIASSSQRAIILYLDNFEFNENVIPWMMSTGCLGPSLSWDKRLNFVPPDSSVVLNRKDWRLKTSTTPIVFKEEKSTEKTHRKHLENALQKTFESIKFDYKRWALPLSGGYDSRGILSYLLSTSDTKDLKTLTWGLKSSLSDKKNDAYLAKRLSGEFNISNQYYFTNLSEEPAEKVLDRFLINGEGRLDNFAGYMDGFKLWKTLFDSGIQGIIRGDEGMGWTDVSSSLTVRLSVGLALCSDYSNLRYIAKKHFPDQEIPESLKQRKNESLKQWQDRLYQGYHTPFILSSLGDLKLSYVEMANPLLSRKILSAVRTLPDYLRKDRALYKKIVNSRMPKIPIARHHAEAVISNSVRQKKVVDLIIKALNSNLASELFPEELLNQVLSKIKISDSKKHNEARPFSVPLILKRLLPLKIKNFLKDHASSRMFMDNNLMAFRMFIIIKMNELLQEKHEI
ncbi:hypothetical protein [Marinilabilia rubra]|uniref:Asparagine synthetase domain-containing protein n=1 Tax=Marinilabilia rubra TaxID=2162893 RepID=A0A2U2B7I7_9BACT|nr:hypothetical protein [Marinilabilia rubra]PWD99004.1 hypothetical protein DDZ16_12120 [Marinilabilia rubra]